MAVAPPPVGSTWRHAWSHRVAVVRWSSVEDGVCYSYGETGRRNRLATHVFLTYFRAVTADRTQ